MATPTKCPKLDTNTTKTITVNFKSNSPNSTFIIDTTKKFAIPLVADPSTLSKLLLSLSTPNSKFPKAPNFHFFVNGELLQSSLKLFFEKNNTEFSAEKVVTIEYSEDFELPLNNHNLVQNEWISCVELVQHRDLESTIIFCGDFDGKLTAFRIDDKNNKDYNDTTLLGEVNASVHGLNAMKLINEVSVGENLLIATCANDFKIKLWEADFKSSSFKLRCEKSLAKNSTSLASWGALVASGESDNAITLFKIKPLKTSNSKHNEYGDFMCDQVGSAPKSHTDVISCLCWPSESAFYSGSWDRSISLWDTESCSKISNWLCGEVVTGLDFSIQRNLGVSSHSSGNIFLWDFRLSSKGNNLAKKFSTASWASSTKWGSDGNGIYSADYSGAVSLWDIRANKKIKNWSIAEDSKAFCLDNFGLKSGFVVGGEFGLRAFC